MAGLLRMEILPPPSNDCDPYDLELVCATQATFEEINRNGGIRGRGIELMVAADAMNHRIADGAEIHTALEGPMGWHSAGKILSRLPNRVLARERIDRILLTPREEDVSTALLLINIDTLGFINEIHGDTAGELVLSTVASRLNGLLRPGDTVTRYSGNEFALLCNAVRNPQALIFLATRINDEIRQRIDHNGVMLTVTASIGIVVSDDKTTAEEMLRHAAAATQAAKAAGRNCWQFFDERLHEGARRRRQLGAGLLRSIERRELSTRFQPIVAAETGRIVGAELLLRWDSSNGSVSPSEFIPIAEKTGTIVSIGRWAFRKGCEAEASWRRRWGTKAPYVSVNISVRQLIDDSVAEDFAAILKETGAEPSRVLLEVTETLLMTDVEANLRVLRRMTDLGLRLAIDDFGTGYSSLAQLTRLPIDVLKIDRAFIADILTSAESRAVIGAIMSLGRSLALDLVAEGVETEAQRNALLDYGCDYIQGYHFHCPLEEAVFTDTFEREIKASAVSNDTPDALLALHCLIYVSEAALPMSSSELSKLKDQADRSNRVSDITGCLIYQDGGLMQMLEGSKTALTALMAKIVADKRHRNVRVVIEGPVKRRVFPRWGMVLRDRTSRPDGMDFTNWQRRRLSFIEMSEDARLCHAHITAYAADEAIYGPAVK